MHLVLLLVLLLRYSYVASFHWQENGIGTIRVESSRWPLGGGQGISGIACSTGERNGLKNGKGEQKEKKRERSKEMENMGSRWLHVHNHDSMIILVDRASDQLLIYCLGCARIVKKKRRESSTL